MKRALEIFPDIESVLVADTNCSTMDLRVTFQKSKDDFKRNIPIIKVIIELFERMSFWTVMTEYGNSPTISFVLYALQDLYLLSKTMIEELTKIEATNSADTTIVQSIILSKNIVKTFQVQLMHTFKLYRKKKVYYMAKVLDPRVLFLGYVKGNPKPGYNKAGWLFLNEEEREQRVQEFDLLKEFYQRKFKSEERNENLNTGERDDETNDENFFPLSEIGNSATLVSDFETSWTEEVKRYQKIAFDFLTIQNAFAVNRNGDPNVILNVDPLAFWRKYKEQLPFLYKCAKVILSIPAQSAASERVFSAMTAVISKQRTSLAGRRASALIESVFRQHSKSRKDKTRKKNDSFPPFGDVRNPVQFVDLELLEQEEDSDWDPEDPNNAEDSDSGDDDEDYDSEDRRLSIRLVL